MKDEINNYSLPYTRPTWLYGLISLWKFPTQQPSMMNTFFAYKILGRSHSLAVWLPHNNWILDSTEALQHLRGVTITALFLTYCNARRLKFQYRKYFQIDLIKPHEMNNPCQLFLTQKSNKSMRLIQYITSWCF